MRISNSLLEGPNDHHLLKIILFKEHLATLVPRRRLNRRSHASTLDADVQVRCCVTKQNNSSVYSHSASRIIRSHTHTHIRALSFNLYYWLELNTRKGSVLSCHSITPVQPSNRKRAHINKNQEISALSFESRRAVNPEPDLNPPSFRVCGPAGSNGAARDICTESPGRRCVAGAVVRHTFTAGRLWGATFHVRRCRIKENMFCWAAGFNHDNHHNHFLCLFVCFFSNNSFFFQDLINTTYLIAAQAAIGFYCIIRVTIFIDFFFFCHLFLSASFFPCHPSGFPKINRNILNRACYKYWTDFSDVLAKKVQCDYSQNISLFTLPNRHVHLKMIHLILEIKSLFLSFSFKYHRMSKTNCGNVVDISQSQSVH